MKKLQITNSGKCHYEIIESVILKYKFILKIDDDEIDIYLYNIKENNSFNNYIKNKYPNLKLKKIDKYDYLIECTIRDCNYEKLDKSMNSNKRYISHNITPRLEKLPNVFFLTNLAKNYFYADKLPFSEKKKQIK